MEGDDHEQAPTRIDVQNKCYANGFPKSTWCQREYVRNFSLQFYMLSLVSQVGEQKLET